MYLDSAKIIFLLKIAPFIKHKKVKIYIKISYIRSYMFRSIWTIRRELTLSPAKVTSYTFVEIISHTLHGNQYTHHNLKHMLPQHITYNDVSLLIISTKV